MIVLFWIAEFRIRFSGWIRILTWSKTEYGSKLDKNSESDPELFVIYSLYWSVVYGSGQKLRSGSKQLEMILRFLIADSYCSMFDQNIRKNLGVSRTAKLDNSVLLPIAFLSIPCHCVVYVERFDINRSSDVPK